MEALIGAMYLDQGFSVAHDFVSRFILTRLSDIVENELHVDAKSNCRRSHRKDLELRQYTS